MHVSGKKCLIETILFHCSMETDFGDSPVRFNPCGDKISRKVQVKTGEWGMGRQMSKM